MGEALKALTYAQIALGKVSKLANLVQQNLLFRSSFEATFGCNKSIPETNATRWNSVWMQSQAIVQLELQKLSDLLKSTAHNNLVLSARDQQQLQEIVEVLVPFAHLTDICQGNNMTTISCVIPGIPSLDQMLTDKELTTHHSASLIHSFLTGKNTLFITFE